MTRSIHPFMYVRILFFLLLGPSVYAQQKGCETKYFKSGTQIHYIFHNPPELTYLTSNYFDLPKLNQIEIAEKYLKETPWYIDMLTQKIKKTYKDSIWGTLYDVSEKENKKNTTTDRLFRCSNNQLQYLPFAYSQIIKPDTTLSVYPNTGSIIQLLKDTVNKKFVGFTASFASGYPLEMQKGQSLPDVLAEFSIIPASTHSSIMFSHSMLKNLADKNETDLLGSLLNQVNNTYGFKLSEEFILKSSITEKWIKNRKITESKIITLNGVSYTAYMVKEEIWSYVGQCPVDSKNPWTDLFNKKFQSEKNKAIADAWVAKYKPNNEGYFVERTETWYIPGIGPYERKMYNNIGVNVFVFELKGIK